MVIGNEVIKMDEKCKNCIKDYPTTNSDKIKNYYLIWDDCSDISFTVCSFTQYILNNQLYTIWSNIIIGDKNIICIST